MINDAEIAALLVTLYSGAPYAWDIHDPGSVDGICWAAVRIDSITYILLRGSVTLQDWLRDAMAFANPFIHDDLGPCHPGFYLGMHELWLEIQAKTTGPWVVSGHSLGAGRASILAAIMTLDGKAPLRRVCFGEPKPGFAKLASVLAGVPGASYRNGDGWSHDLVTDVPLSFPPEEYVHPAALTQVTAPPGGDLRQQLGIFSWHKMGLYAAALAAKV